ncbi:hypothetical protein ISF12_10870 [Pseudomonas aeruginosa]|nr:hypothetical protein [Pseudomonas aeruginosa]
MSIYDEIANVIARVRAAPQSGDHERDLEHDVPRGIVRLCEAVTDKMVAMGATTVTVAEVIRLEATCTGSDYWHKLPLRCSFRVQEALSVAR